MVYTQCNMHLIFPILIYKNTQPWTPKLFFIIKSIKPHLISFIIHGLSIITCLCCSFIFIQNEQHNVLRMFSFVSETHNQHQPAYWENICALRIAYIWCKKQFKWDYFIKKQIWVLFFSWYTVNCITHPPSSYFYCLNHINKIQ